MEFATARIKKGAGRSLKAGGAWIYDNEIELISGHYQNGDMVNVEDFDGYPLGQGFINTNSTITIRMMTRKKGVILDETWIEQRVRGGGYVKLPHYLWGGRLSPRNCCR